MKTRTFKRRAVKSARPALARPAIDYPQDAETLGCPRYTLRISAPGAHAVTVAVDQGDWQDCRESVGYWWFDWTPELAGEHELIACAEYPGGREAVSDVVHCFS